MKTKINPIKQETEYIAFLEKALNSQNFRNNEPDKVPVYEEKLKKARFKLKVLKGEVFGKKA